MDFIWDILNWIGAGLVLVAVWAGGEARIRAAETAEEVMAAHDDAAAVIAAGMDAVLAG